MSSLLPPIAHSEFSTKVHDAKREDLVATLIGTPSPRLVIPFSTRSEGSYKLVMAALDDRRVHDHFDGRNVTVSCDAAENTEDTIGLLAASLSVDVNGDAIGAILDNFAKYKRTLVVLDKLECIYAVTDVKQQEKTEILLATLASVDELALVVIMCGTPPPDCVAWTNLNENWDEIQLEVAKQVLPNIHEDLNPSVITPSLTSTSPGDDQFATLEHIHTEVRGGSVSTTISTTATFRSDDKDDASYELRFTQTPTGPLTIAQSKVPPPKPTVFHGRNKEVEQLVAQTMVPSGAPLGIVGPGGIGKTTLALKVLHDDRVRAHFGRQRFFITCEGANGPEEVLFQLATKLGIRPSQNMYLWSAVLDELHSRQRTLLVLDNFETIWSPTNEVTREASEIFLAQLVVNDELTVIVTTRGNTLPESFTWSNIKTAELDTLSSTAALQTFEDLSYIEPAILEANRERDALVVLLREVDYMPLAVTLLARLDDLPSRLLREWREHYTEVLEADRHDGTRRELSVQVSIKISLTHLPTETVDIRPRQLLSVLGQLPAGLFQSVANELHSTITNLDSAKQVLLRHSLVYSGGLGELRMLSPVRHYVNHILPMTNAIRSATEQIYMNICHAPPHPTLFGSDGPTYDLELPNIVGILSVGLDRPTEELASAVFHLAAYCLHRGYSCLRMLRQLLPHLGHDILQSAECLKAIAYDHRAAGENDSALEHFERAADLFAEAGEISMQAIVRHSLARLYTQLGRQEDGDREMSRSQQLLRRSDASYFAVPSPEEDLAVAEDRLRAARADYLQAGDPAAVAATTVRILEMVKARGDHEEYTQELELSVEISDKSMPGSSMTALLQTQLAESYLENGVIDAAESLLIEAHTAATDHNERHILGSITRAFGRLRHLQGRFYEASELFHTAARFFRECGWDTEVQMCEQRAGELLVEAGNVK